MTRLLEHFDLVVLIRRINADNELNTEQTQEALRRDALNELVERLRHLRHGTNNPRCTCCNPENVLAVVERLTNSVQLPD